MEWWTDENKTIPILSLTHTLLTCDSICLMEPSFLTLTHWPLRDVAEILKIIIISIFRLRCCPCHIQWGWTLALQASLSCGSKPVRPHSLISVLAHSDHVFLGLPVILGPGSRRSVTDLIQDLACCTCPYHLSHLLRRTAVISLLPNFWSSETEDVSSWSLVPPILWIMALLGQSCSDPTFRQCVA